MSYKDAIAIQNLKIDCIIGVLPHERIIPQQVVADVEMNLDLTAAGETGELARTVDYALTARQVSFILETAKFELLETAALAICTWIAAPVPSAHLYSVESVEVRLRKPAALDGNGIPEIRVKRHSRDIKSESYKEGGVIQEILFAANRVALIRVHHLGTENIPGSPNQYPCYKDLFTGPRDFLRIAWKADS